MAPKFSKISPLKGFKRIFSLQSLVNLIKSIALVGIIGFVVFRTIIDKKGALLNLYEVSLMEAILYIGDLVLDLGIKISAIYLIVGIGISFIKSEIPKRYEDDKAGGQG